MVYSVCCSVLLGRCVRCDVCEWCRRVRRMLILRCAPPQMQPALRVSQFTSNTSNTSTTLTQASYTYVRCSGSMGNADDDGVGHRTGGCGVFSSIATRGGALPCTPPSPATTSNHSHAVQTSARCLWQPSGASQRLWVRTCVSVSCIWLCDVMCDVC